MACEIDWTALQPAIDDYAGFRNLETLHLRQIIPPPPKNVLENILRQSPRLASLRLYEAIPKEVHLTNKKHGPSSIPLKTLVLCRPSDHLDKISQLLFALDISQDTRTICVAVDNLGIFEHVSVTNGAFELAVPRILEKYRISLEKPDQMGTTNLCLSGFEGGEDYGESSSCVLSRTSAVGDEVN